MKNNIACYILSYEVTKGMKSYGPLGLLKNEKNTQELIVHQIDSLKKIFKNPHISVVTGFGADKLSKKLGSSVEKIYNQYYDSKNQGHAVKLILSNFDSEKYSGLFIMDNNTLLKNSISINPQSFKNSWVLSRKIKKNDSKRKYKGLVLGDADLVDYIFYDVGKTVWCNSVYFCSTDIRCLKTNINMIYDNMFLFEIINRSIENNMIKYDHIPIPGDTIHVIEGIKDKNKIKI